MRVLVPFMLSHCLLIVLAQCAPEYVALVAQVQRYRSRAVLLDFVQRLPVSAHRVRLGCGREVQRRHA